MNFLDWIKKHIAITMFLFTITGSILGFIGGMIVSYYAVQSKFEVIDNGFEKMNFKMDLVKKEFENVYEVFHILKTHIDEKTNKSTEN